MTRQKDEAPSVAQGEIGRKAVDRETPAARHLDDKPTMMPPQRDPSDTLRGCQRILILGRTGSGKTTLKILNDGGYSLVTAAHGALCRRYEVSRWWWADRGQAGAARACAAGGAGLEGAGWRPLQAGPAQLRDLQTVLDAGALLRPTWRSGRRAVA
jgi:hypothetical protein